MKIIHPTKQREAHHVFHKFNKKYLRATTAHESQQTSYEMYKLKRTYPEAG